MSLRHLSLGILLAAAALLAGCETDPYCVNCGDDDAGAGDAGDTGDAMADGSVSDAFVPDTGLPADGGLPDGCLAVEICNELDDDCDGEVDEDFDTSVDVEHCGGCDNFCGPPHAFPVCTDGVCGISDCDVGFYDLDGELDNGCEYRCAGTETDDFVCNNRDDDCDGEVDEDIDLENDLTNCGICGRDCTLQFDNASASCEVPAGETVANCAIGPCDDNFWNIDGRDINGCEYACTPADPPTELCNLADDDCDGTRDEGDPEGGGSCGTDVGECSTGIEQCVGGDVICMGAVEPTTELCNGLDDDCDGEADEGNPEGGRLCGPRTGTCVQGREQCNPATGSLDCVGAIGPSTEICDGLDNDCDGTIDEGNPGGGAACGDTTGACTAGTETCVGGTIQCVGGTGPSPELCDLIDNDCDGVADEGNPEGGSLCGSDVGTCAPGVQQCNTTTGELECIGAVGAETEVCDGLDNDCDGSVDEGNPGGGAACGDTTGACTAGTVTCTGGALQCLGAGGPTPETCNGLDDDCDGLEDEDYLFDTDVLHCGDCATNCFTEVENASPTCVSGTCGIGSCNAGFHDLDGDPTNGCEYECTIVGGEGCNGSDDDCDGLVDEGLTAPAGYCNPNGVCAGTSATCSGSLGWTCVYPSTYEESEASCDELDNDCDGLVDEPFADKGDACDNGALGACLRTGTFVCNSSWDDVVCNAAPSPGGTTETCNGEDDDCDGVIDNGMTPSVVPTVPVPRAGGGTVYVMAYEASRPDATSTGAGSMSSHACADANVLPWTTVTWPEARDACCALNDSGTCAGDGSGWRLCDAADWETSCEAGTSCTWSYSTSCGTGQRQTCNGKEYDCDSSTSGDEDCLMTTASPTFPACYADWGASGRIYDLSGNAREWTATSRGTDIYELRGGSYTNIEAGRTCQFDFTVAPSTFSHPTTGFRCCYY